MNAPALLLKHLMICTWEFVQRRTLLIYCIVAGKIIYSKTVISDTLLRALLHRPLDDFLSVSFKFLAIPYELIAGFLELLALYLMTSR